METTASSGVVTCLLTDVEGSTKLLHELGDGYADALHEHRRLLREAFTAHEDAEVDTQGDVFFVAFGRPSDGVAAAADAQLALAGGSIRVLIEQAPRVDLLTTSRERLQVQSERVLDLEGLDLGNRNVMPAALLAQGAGAHSLAKSALARRRWD